MNIHLERYNENANQALWAEVKRQMVQQHGYVEQQEQQLTLELFRVLLCKAYVEKTMPGLSLTMSMPPLLDAAWHAMILNTEMYAAFCTNMLMLPAGTGVLPHTTTTDGDELVLKNKRITVTEIMYRAMWTSQGIDIAPAFWQREVPEEVAPQEDQKECKHRCKDKTSCKHACCHRGEPNAKKAKVDDPQDQLPETPFQIFIKAVDGSTFALQVSRGMPIVMVKHLVQIKRGTPWDQIRLVYAGFTFDDLKKIEDTPIRPDCTMHLVLRLRGC